MRRAGKAHWITITGALGVVVLAVILFFSQESPEQVCNRWFRALADADVATLVDLSYYEGDQAKLRQQWDFAVNVAGPHYLFRWKTITAKEHDATHAAVLTQVERNLSETSFEEEFDIPMVKGGNKWKVDVRSLSKLLYPALPR